MPRYSVVPVPKPRMTQRDRWARRPAVLRYRAFCDEVRAQGIELYPCGLHITFVIPMPKSWSKRKRKEMDGQPHQQKPDWDNLAKALCDAVYDEDAHIWDMRCTKLWGREGAIIIERNIPHNG